MNKIKNKIKIIIKDNLNKMFGNKELFNNLKMTWRLTKGARKYLLYIVLLLLVIAITGAIGPMLSAKQIVYINGQLWEKLIKITVTIFIFKSINHIFLYLFGRVNQIFFRKLLTNIQIQLSKEIFKTNIKEMDKNGTGVFITRLNSDSRSIADIFTKLIMVISEIAGNIGVLIAIFMISKLLFIYFIITIILIFNLNKIMMKIRFNREKELRKIDEKNTNLISEMIRGLRDIKLLNFENNFIKKMEKNILNSNDKRFEMNEVERKWNLGIRLVNDILDFTFFGFGILLINYNLLTIENFIIIYMYKGRLYGLLGYFTRMLEHIKEFNLSANRVFELFEGEKFKKEEYGEKELENVHGNIEFKNVEFGYTENKKVLKDISFKINAHEKVAFVGKSGQGKSTIFSLISKMYTPNGGEILIDNVNINELAKNTLRNNIAIVNQMPYIFNMTIKENLQIIKPNVTDEEIIEVCKSASLHETIVNMENGYDTVVGEGGVTLSGGQRQRLAIARALLTNSKIILFDEATSALDNETQTEITKAIDNLKGKYTILIVAHRLSTIADCDRIFIVDNGKIKASGTHKELMKNSKIYKKLYESEV